MSERKLATIQVIEKIDPIEGKDRIGLATVPMLPDFTINGQSVDDMVELSKFKSSVYDTLAEGKVYRVTDDRGMVMDSFKVINPDFLIKYGD